MTMRQRRAGAPRGRRDSRGRLALPSFPLFLLAVCASVTVGATAVRALVAGGHAPQVLSGTAERLLAFLDYFAGVFTLLSLTAAVLCGLAATDRLVLTPRLRVAAQSVHRATSVAAVGFLATHIGVKIAEHDASPLTALLPFGGGATFAVGLGTLAADLLVLAAATGAVRGRFADARRPGLWRVLHASAYACWPIALAHGLTAGRAAAVWVLWSYGVCAALVALALLVRALGLLDRLASTTHATRAVGLRAYRARRPSRITLAELGALSREHEPAPHTTHAAALAERPAATTAAPDRPREHPRLADTPPNGVPVATPYGDGAGHRPRATAARHAAGAPWAGGNVSGDNPGIPVQGAHHAHPTGRSNPTGAGHATGTPRTDGEFSGAPTAPRTGGARHRAAAPGAAGRATAPTAHPSRHPAPGAWGEGHAAAAHWTGHGIPADLGATGGGHPAATAEAMGTTGAHAWAASHAPWPQPQAAPAPRPRHGAVASPPWAGGGTGRHAGAPTWEHATGQVPGPGAWSADPWDGPWGGAHHYGGGDVPHYGPPQQPGAVPGVWSDWTSAEASGEWGPLTWDAPATGGVAG